MKWYYESHGLPQGPISDKELRQLKEEGKLLGEARVWSKGMAEWAPLNSLREFFPGPQRLPQPESGLPSLPNHTHRPNGSPVPAPESEHQAAMLEASPTEERVFDFTHLSGEPEPLQDAPDFSEIRPEWEHLKRTGPLGAFILSLREILLEPKYTFLRLPGNGGWGLPLGFLLVSEFLGNIFMILTLRQMPASRAPVMQAFAKMLPMEGGDTFLLYSITASACMLPLVVLIKAALLHVPMRVIARSHHSFATTFRTLCYSLGAGSMLWGIPLAVMSVAGASGEEGVASMALRLSTTAVALWSAYVNIRAMASSHGVSLGRACAAILLFPTIAGVLLVMLLGVLAALS